MSAFETIMIDFMVGLSVMEFARLMLTAFRMIKRDWRRKDKDE